jgi:hypothetical protein
MRAAQTVALGRVQAAGHRIHPQRAFCHIAKNTNRRYDSLSQLGVPDIKSMFFIQLFLFSLVPVGTNTSVE